MARNVLRTLLPQAVRNWREARYFRRFGEIEMRLVDLLCRPDQDAIDIGANYGGYIFFMRRSAKRVIAFEPIPEFALLLRRKFPANVTVETIALSDRAGLTQLYMPIVDGEMVAGCSTLSTEALANYLAHRKIEVRTDRLDSVYAGMAGFIKIDVEGHEQAVLEGAAETIDRCRPHLLIELDESLSAGALGRARAFLASRGYRGYYVHSGRLQEIEQFSAADLQHPSNKPVLTARLEDRNRLGPFINNFIFLPPTERDEILNRIRKRLD